MGKNQDPGSGINILDPQHWWIQYVSSFVGRESVIKDTNLPTPLTHNNTQQHTTTLHNSTQVHKTTNVPVIFMARYVMILRGATSLFGALVGVGPENLDFFAPFKIITYRAIKTTGTFIVILPSHIIIFLNPSESGST
jgi:hypothetical protein